ncbi:MAG TPA: hypothetical protein VN638_01060 [Nitrospiraceae bacterium]|nr:hypothetical protein [Nitrospiraceae bacterium]
MGSERVLQGYLCPEYKVSAVRVEPVERDELDPEDEVKLQHIRRQLIV